ncbi:putative thioredoxin [Jatrophihabitans endophyticus]|uniref:Putative thioredoxin n=1 Tax=Jatrophihabitans endophyticus TaxID=1206085 RepID=A0A1M5DF21_9ACTN|nr:tetratricopeptide repeat protein [Jatrophihabitans endophyticus]SHF65567.1 putative thioredoxin [Jatrophihabitans endophyticus]
MAGAVDLAALKARNEAAARAAEAPAPTAGQYVVDVTEAGFQTDVLDRSFQVPVLLVLVSSRAPSGDQLAATLETVVTQQAGALVLGKVDVDANMRIAQALQAQAVPAVFAVIGGQVVPGFQGALPEAQVTEFVAAVLQAGREAGLSGSAAAPAADGETDPAQAAPEVPEDPRLTAAEDALEAGDYDLAAERYQAILAQEPANAEAQLALGQVRLLQRLDSIDAEAAARADGAPDDVPAQLAAADLAVAGNDVQGALDRLLRTIGLVSGDDRDVVRTRLLEFFDLLGPDDPRVPAARRQLTRALF